MKFLDLAGVKQFKDYTDETFVSTEDYSVIEDVDRDTYTKQEIDTMISDIESGGSDLTNYYTKSQADSKFVEVVSGKQLSTNDYTTAEKNKLSEIESGAQANVQADWSVTNSSSDAYIKNKPSSLPASDVSAWAKAANKPTYTASEVGAQETLVSGTNIKTINNESLLGSGNITISAGSGEANVINTVKVNGTALTPDSNKAVNITVPTVREGELTIKVNGTVIETFGANQGDDDEIDISIPTESTVSGWGFTKNTGTITGITMNGASKGTSGVVDLGTVVTDISGKADKSAAIGSLSLALDSTNYKITLSGTKVDGTTFTVSDVIDLPLESVVVNGSYDDTTKKVVLTLKNGNTVDFSIADLITGLQSEITSTNKLSADLIADGTTNKVVTATEKSTWNGKQDAISDLATIRSNASAGAAKVSNVQSDWNATTGDAVILNKPSIPAAANNATITIQKGGTNVDSFTVNASSNKSINIPNELPSYSASDSGKILSVNSSGQLV